MLREYEDVRQHEEGFRRYFFDDWFDLYVWYDEKGGTPKGFQLVYDKYEDPHSITWTTMDGCRHNKVDDGEDRPGAMKMTPILVPDGVFEKESVRGRFEKASGSLEPSVRAFVLSGMESCPSETVSVFRASGGGRASR